MLSDSIDGRQGCQMAPNISIVLGGILLSSRSPGLLVVLPSDAEKWSGYNSDFFLYFDVPDLARK